MAASCNFAIIGGGWRAEFFVRASRGTGGAFVCQGVNLRRPERREEWGRRLGMATFGSIDETLDHNPDFLVVSVPRESAVAVVEEIFQKSKVPVLLETPPGLEVAELRRAWGLTRAGAKVQVAEQYRWQPHHAARIALLNRGLLGERYEATVSVAHGYHAASLLSEYLGLQGNEWQRLSVTARRLVSRVIPGPGRGGPPADAAPVPSERTVAVLSDGKKHGIYDFDGEQYFSEIRSQHVAVRGERGELRDDLVSYISDGGAWRATQDHLVRVEGGQGGDLHLLGLRGDPLPRRADLQHPSLSCNIVRRGDSDRQMS